MEELKLLIGMVADLPEMALWVLAAFFIYKVVIIGSIFGVVRLAITKWHDWAVTPKEKMRKVNYTAKLNDITLTGEVPALMKQVERIKCISGQVAYSNGKDNINSSDVEWLKDAIDKKLEEEK